MKIKTLILLFSVFAAALVSCKKENQVPANPAVNPVSATVIYPIAGKWQEVKLHEYNQDQTTGVTFGDTTFQAPAFGKFDYAQFNNNSTCILSQTGLHYSGTPTPTVVQATQNYTFAPAGSGFALAEVFKNDGLINEVSKIDTVSSFSSNLLTVHSVITYENPTVKYKTIADAYYTR
jgi:hypothetical protein